MGKLKRGYVYVLTNPSMPGCVKVGRSAHGGQRRASQLYQTGVPAPFALHFKMLFDDASEGELRAHEIRGYCRSNGSREFFTTTPDIACSAVLSSWAGLHEIYACNPEDSPVLLKLYEIEESTGLDVFDIWSAIKVLGENAVCAAAEEARQGESECPLRLSLVSEGEG